MRQPANQPIAITAPGMLRVAQTGKGIEPMSPTDKRANLWMDLLLVAFLVALNVAARLLPHAPGFLPVAASGLFAAHFRRTDSGWWPLMCHQGFPANRMATPKPAPGP